MATERQMIDVAEARGYVETFMADPILKLAANAVLNNTPRVDAVEVVHGRWLDVQETDMYVPDMKFTITKTAETCSNCKVRIGFIGAKQYLFDAVCPNCGAKMDGDGNG